MVAQSLHITSPFWFAQQRAVVFVIGTETAPEMLEVTFGFCFQTISQILSAQISGLIRRPFLRKLYKALWTCLYCRCLPIEEIILGPQWVCVIL